MTVLSSEEMSLRSCRGRLGRIPEKPSLLTMTIFSRRFWLLFGDAVKRSMLSACPSHLQCPRLSNYSHAGDMMNGTNIYPLNFPVIEIEMGPCNASDNMGWFEFDGPRVPKGQARCTGSRV